MSILALYHLNELEGEIAEDSSNNGLDATVTGALIETPGLLGAACRDLDGLNDNIYVNHTPILNLNAKDFSLIAWFNANDLSGFQRLICGDSITQPNVYSMLLNGDKLAYQINNKGHVNTSIGAFSASTKQMAGFSYNHTTGKLRLYVNGSFDVEYSPGDTPGPGNTNLRLGHTAGIVQVLDGLLDEVAVADEIWDDTFFTYHWDGGAGREIEGEAGVQIFRRRMEGY